MLINDCDVTKIGEYIIYEWNGLESQKIIDPTKSKLGENVFF